MAHRERTPYSISIFNTRYVWCGTAINLARAGLPRMAWYAMLKLATRTWKFLAVPNCTGSVVCPRGRDAFLGTIP